MDFGTCAVRSKERSDETNIRLVRHYWASIGKPEKSIIVSRKNAYHGSSIGAASLGGMESMHSQGGLPIPDIIHIGQPYWYGEGRDILKSAGTFRILPSKFFFF